MFELPRAFIDAIRDRYVLERLIGVGGMATVHLARDVRHNRPVAIKVLKPELSQSVGAERFLKEIEIAARLTHPLIIPLHDSGQAAGLLYYVMPLIDGESLRTTLQREGRLAKDTAIGIAEQIGHALSYAHRQGVLHRDIKPENILFSEGHPMVADFGIARALSTATDAHLTKTGLALGTPGYMSPEQAAGDRETDARTDVYGLGCLLYEMLIGEPPGIWQTDAEAMRLEKFVDVPDAHRAGIRDMGRRVERALVRALAMRVRDRHESVDAFLRELRRDSGAVRRYSDREVEDIVRQATDEELADPEAGMSLKTVQSIAAEVGIAPELVERAAQKLEAAELTDVGSSTFWLGSPTTLGTELVVAGEATEAAREEIVDEIEATFAAPGNVEVRGASLTWRTEKPAVGKRRAIQVRVTSRGGQTRIQSQERLGELAASIFPSITVGGGVPVLAILLSLGGPEFGFLPAGLLGVTWVAGMHAIARTVFRAIARGKRRDLETLGERLAEIAAESDRERSEEMGAPPALR